MHHNWFPLGLTFLNFHLYLWFQGSFDAKDATASAHAGITQATAYYPYDPTLGQYQYDRYVVFYVSVHM